jgi:hypothetical protein
MDEPPVCFGSVRANPSIIEPTAALRVPIPGEGSQKAQRTQNPILLRIEFCVHVRPFVANFPG